MSEQRKDPLISEVEYSISSSRVLLEVGTHMIFWVAGNSKKTEEFNLIQNKMFCLNF